MLDPVMFFTRRLSIQSKLILLLLLFSLKRTPANQRGEARMGNLQFRSR